MNVLLWALQIVLALKFVSVTTTHGLRPDETKMERGTQRLGVLARPLLTLTAVGAFLGGAGVILPAATGFLTWLTPWSAALLAVMMLFNDEFHGQARTHHYGFPDEDLWINNDAIHPVHRVPPRFQYCTLPRAAVNKSVFFRGGATTD